MKGAFWLHWKQLIKARLLRPFLWAQVFVNWLVYLVSAALSLLTLASILAFLWLFASEPGGSWLLRQLPGVQIEGFSGQLLNRWQLEELSWQQEELNLRVQGVSFAWQPWCLLNLTLCLREVHAQEVELHLPTAEADEPGADGAGAEETVGSFRMPELELPEINLPLGIRLESLQLGRLTLNQQVHLTNLQLRQLVWVDTKLQWQQLSLQSPWLPLDEETTLQAQGAVEFQGDWPLQLQVAASLWQQPFQADLGGSLQHLVIHQLGTADERLQLRGELALFTPTLPARLQLELHQLNAAELMTLARQEPPDLLARAGDALLLERLELEVTGDLEKGWQATKNTQLLLDQQPYALDIQAQMDWDELVLDSLTLASGAQPGGAQPKNPQHWLTLSGGYQFAPQTARLHLHWQDLLGSPLPWSLLLDEPPELPLIGEDLQLQLAWQNRQLYLGGGLKTLLLWQGDQAEFSSRFAGHLDLQELPEPTPDLPLSDQLMAWAEQINLGVEAELEGRLERQNQPFVHQSFASQMQMDFFWQGATRDYWLNIPRLSLDGVDDEHLEASLKMNRDLWQLNLSVHLADLASLTKPWPLDLAGDLVLNARASLPSLLDFNEEQLLHPQWQDYLLEADYRLRASTESLDWSQGKITETALALEYSGFIPRLPGEQPLALRLFSRSLQLDDQQLDTLRVQTRGTLAEHQLNAHLNYQQQPLSLELKGGWQQQKEGVQVSYQLADWDLEPLAAFLPDELLWQGQVSGNLDLALVNENFLASAELVTRQGRLSVFTREEHEKEQEKEQEQNENRVDFDYQQLALHFKLEPETAAVALSLQGEELGLTEIDLQLSLTPEATTGQRPLEGRYLLTATQLQLFLPFLTMDDLTGYLEGEGRIAGYLDAPEVWGELAIRELAATDLTWPLSLNRLDARLQLEARQARLEGFFEAGREGQGQLAGQLDWSESLEAEIHLAAENLALRVEPWASLEVNPQLTFRLEQGQASLSGQVAIPRGDINVQQLPRQAVRVSADARVVNRPEPEPGPITAFNLDIELVLGSDRVSLDAFGLVADIQGRLRVTDEMATHGELRLVNGRYQSFGQDLRLRRAQLNFNGPADLPFLDIEALRQVDDVIAGLRITGRVDQAETEIFSEPPMSSEQALSWLLTGGPLEAETDPNMLALSLGLAGVSDYTRAAGEAVGLKDLELSAEGEGEDASVVASAYLNRRLSVRYGVGIYDDISRVALRYELTRRLYIEVVSSLENSLDIYWEVDY